MYCRENCAVKYEDDDRVAVTLRCRSWTCPECANDRSLALQAQAHGGRPTTFLTLTYRVRSNRTTFQAALELSRAWRLLRLRIMRKLGWDHLPFLAVFERTKAGWPHLHILLRCGYIDQKYISTQMYDLIGSPIVHIVKIDNNKKVVSYVAKYCSKDAHKFGTAKRYWQSRDWDLREKPEYIEENKTTGGWELWPKTLEFFEQMWTAFGYTVTRRGEDVLFARAPDTS